MHPMRTMHFAAIGGLLLYSVCAHAQVNPLAADPQLPQRKAALSRLILHLVNETPTIRWGESPKISISVENRGKTTVRLIQPGDGSLYGWRTPIIGWSVVHAGSPRVTRSEKLPPFESGQCGVMEPSLIILSIASLKRSDIAAGSTIPVGQLQREGKYRIAFYYINDTHTVYEKPRTTVQPSSAGKQSANNLLAEFGVTGLLPYNQPNAQDLIKRTTPCVLRSNEVIVTVKARAVKPAK